MNEPLNLRLVIAARAAAGETLHRLEQVPREFRRAVLADSFLNFEMVTAEFRDRFSPEQIALLRREFYGGVGVLAS